MTVPDESPRRGRYAPDFLTELFRNPLDPGYADAAQRRAGEPPAGRRWPTRLITVLTVAVVGFLFAVAYRQTVAAEPTRTQARGALVDQIQRQRAETDRLQARAEQLRARVSELRERELGGPAASRLRNLEAETGLAPVRGDGVRVALGDGKVPIDPVTGQRSTIGRVQDRDLQLVANALWAVGAEAIAINDQRLTATSTIRLAGEAILVDFRPVTNPYEVVAIGPADIEEQFRASYAGRVFRQLVSEVGMSFDVRAVEDVTLPAAAEPRLRFVEPSVQPSAEVPASPEATESLPPGGDPPDADPSSSSSEGGR